MKLPRISDKNLLFNQVKRNFPMLLLFMIIFLLAIPLCTMISLGQDVLYPVNFSDYQDYVNAVQAYGADVVKGVGYAAVILSAMMGVFAACSVSRYLMNRTSAVLFGSLPVRREKQLAIHFSAGAFCYAASFIVASLVQLLVLAAKGYAGYFPAYLSYAGMGVMWFLLFYALTLFIGMVCGMSSMQFVMTGVAVFYLPATWALMLSAVDVFYVNTDLTYYFSWDFNKLLSPAIRMIECLEKPLGFIEVIVYLLVSVLLIVFAGLIFKKRNHAKAGQPFVFDRVASVVKYLLLLPATLAVGALFAVLEDTLWLAVGFFLGGFLSFMLLNVLFTKNTRAFFHHFKGFCIYAVSFTVCFLVLAVDPFKIDDYIPEIDEVKSAQVNLWGPGVEFTAEESIDNINKLVKYATAEQKSSTSFNNYTYNGGYYFRVVYKLKSGLSICKDVRIQETQHAEKYFAALFNGEEITEAYWQSFDKLEEIDAQGLTYHQGSYEYESFLLAAEDKVQTFKELYKKACGGRIMAEDRGPVILSFWYDNYEFPIYLHEDFEECVQFLTQNALNKVTGMLPSKDNVDVYLAGINSVIVYDEQYEEKLDQIEDPQMIKQMYLASVGFDRSRFFSVQISASQEQRVEFINSSDLRIFSSFLITQE
ncbi:MAG: hypothetical protein HFE77_07690 [Clostridiales bacterium]|nr:hypothetical protein [Clostridiales bacterium]